MNMRQLGKSTRWILPLLVCALAAGGAWATDPCPNDYQGRECQTSQDKCPNVDDTWVDVQVGGEGSVGTEDSCTSSPARDAEGNIVEADLTFRWQRTASQGTLTVTATNVTCDQPNLGTPTIMTIWHNLPDGIAYCDLQTADLDTDGDDVFDDGNVCGDTSCDTCMTTNCNKGWHLSPDDSQVGCIGKLDQELDANGRPDDVGVLPDESIRLVMTCYPPAGQTLENITACDIANAGSDADPGQRTAQVALHFQQLGTDNQNSQKVSSNCQENLFVELASFEATPADGRVILDWRTHMEIDNAGFYLLRRDLVSGEVVRLNHGLIPADGDIYQGASYEYVDDTAINGVQYEYLLVDVDLSGFEGRHPGTLAVANPQDAPIHLAVPVYGSAELRQGDRPTFAWETGSSRPGVLLISADPTFESRDRTMAIAFGRGAAKKGYTLAPSQARQMERLAQQNHDVVYWRVMELAGAGEPVSSETYQVGYGILPGADGRPVNKAFLEKNGAARTLRHGLGVSR